MALIELWLVDLDLCAAGLAAVDDGLGLLPQEDRARAARISDADGRKHRLAAYRALRLLLARHAGSGVLVQPFQRGEHGRPWLEGCALDFSLSHAGAMALIGACDGGRIGVDIEQPRASSIPERRKALIEAAAEALAGSALPDGDPQTRFIAAWTRLEAYAKADGRGMARVLGRIGAIGPETPRSDPLAALGVAPGGLSSWDVAAPAGYRAAVCVLGGGGRPGAPPARDTLQLPASERDLHAILARSATPGAA